jgi:Tol biopolymer transport system component
MVVAASELPPSWILAELSFPGYAAWSPDGGKLAFTAYERPYPEQPWGWTAAVYVKDLRSGDLRRVSDAPRPLVNSVSWSPDGSRISIVEEAPDGERAISWVRVVDLATGTSRTFPQRSIGHPVVWSADGREIAFNDGLGVEIVNTVDESTEPYRVSGGYRVAGSYSFFDPPVWSPDGEWILAAGSSQSMIAARDSDGFDGRRVDGSAGAWSPDGKRLVFRGSPELGDGDIYVTDASGADPREVVRVPSMTSLESIAWSGDGERLLYTVVAGGCRDDDCGPTRLFMVPIDGSAPARELFRHPVIDILPP